MCTLIVLHRCVPGRSLVVAANRDEFFARPAEGPSIRASKTGRVLAPRDLEAGGTWVGLSERGVFAGLTNLRPLATGSAATGAGALGGELGDGRPRTLRSRGEVVMAALEAESASEAIRQLADLAPASHNPFQLLVADAQTAALVVYRDAPQIFPLEPGLHVLGNVEDERIVPALDAALAPTCVAPAGAGAARDAEPPKSLPGFEGIEGLLDTETPRAQKLVRIRSRVEKLLTDTDRDLFEGLARICREHVDEEDLFEPGFEPRPKSPFESTCVHVADRYGTRSSLLLELAEDIPASRFWTTDGPPCRRPFEDRSSLLRELGIRPS